MRRYKINGEWRIESYCPNYDFNVIFLMNHD
jgi:hypothetical protein